MNDKPKHLLCSLRVGECEFIKYHLVHEPPPEGWQPLMALKGHLYRAALIRKKDEKDTMSS